MWKKIIVVIAVLMLLTGIGFLAFPPVSNEIGKIKANGVIEEFEKENENVVNELVDETDGTTVKTFEEAKKRKLVDDEGYRIRWTSRTSYTRTSNYPTVFKVDLDRLHEDSKKYNRSIINNQGTVDTNNYTRAALNMSSYGLSNVYAYMSAPSIGLSLPIYLGANEEMMGYGAAHMNNTSLPLNEKSTNVVVAGHTGYVGRIFFDNIRSLKKGDTVKVTNYWESINYKVTGYKKVEPNQTVDTIIQSGKKLLTLVTCTPLDNGKYGRYLVICEAE